MLPPKLPGRPPTLRLKPDVLKHSQSKRGALPGAAHAVDRNTQHWQQSTHNVADGFDIRSSKVTSQTVKLPTRDTSGRSILKRSVQAACCWHMQPQTAGIMYDVRLHLKLLLNPN